MDYIILLGRKRGAAGVISTMYMSNEKERRERVKCGWLARLLLPLNDQDFSKSTAAVFCHRGSNLKVSLNQSMPLGQYLTQVNV